LRFDRTLLQLEMGMLQATEMPDGITKQSMWTALNPHGMRRVPPRLPAQSSIWQHSEFQFRGDFFDFPCIILAWPDTAR